MATDAALDRIAVITSNPDAEADSARRDLWLGSFSKGLERFPAGSGARNVSVSDDGSAVAWSTAQDGEFRLHVLGSTQASMRSRVLPGRCVNLCLSPDGTRAIAGLATPTGEGWHEPGYWRYKTIRIKSDAAGYWDGNSTGLYLVDLDDEGVVDLVAVDADTVGDRLWPTWDRSGHRIAYVRKEPQDSTEADRSSLWVYETTTGQRKEILAGPGPIHHPVWSPAGDALAFAGPAEPHGGFHIPWDVTVTDLAGHRTNLTLGVQGVGDRILGDLSSGEDWAAGPLWTDRGILYLGDDHGSSQVFQAAGAGVVESLTPAGRHVGIFLASAAGDRLLTTVSTPTRLPCVERSDLGSAGQENVSLLPGADWNNRLQDELILVEPERFQLTSGDGTKIDAWVMRPPASGGEQSRPGPAILQVHGGPHACFGQTFFHEFQWLVAVGYTLLYCNPRGSLGYPADFIASIVGRWGTVDADDILAGLAWLQEQPSVDENRIGLTGGSYGGYMTNWLIGHTNAFRAAVTDRCLANAESFYGTSEIGPFFSEVAFEGSPWTNPEGYRRASPLTYAPSIDTPVLIMHGTEDAQTPIEQAEQFYTALKSMGKEAELVIFPGANHELSRGGRPSQRRARLELMREWFDQYLGGFS